MATLIAGVVMGEEEEEPMRTSRVQGTWMIWVLFTNTGNTGDWARLGSSGSFWAVVEFEVSSRVSRGSLRELNVLKKRAHIFSLALPKDQGRFYPF